MQKRFVFPALALVAFSATAASASPWGHTVDFSYAEQASIRVLQPEGLKVTVDGRDDTIPAVFPLPNTNQFYAVSVTAADGSTWSKKIEVRSQQQSDIKLTYTAAPKAPPKPTVMAGSFVSRMQHCDAGHSWKSVRFDVIKPGSDKVWRKILKPGETDNTKASAQVQTVKIYTGSANNWTLMKETKANFAKANWVVDWGCKPAR